MLINGAQAQSEAVSANVQKVEKTGKTGKTAEDAEVDSVMQSFKDEAADARRYGMVWYGMVC